MKNKLVNGFFLLLIVSIVAITGCDKNDAEISETNPEVREQVEFNRVGCILPSEEEYNSYPKEAEPLSSKLKAIASSKFLSTPPVRNQGGEGSCTAWATAYCARSIMYQYKTGGTFRDDVNVFSPEYVYNQIVSGTNCTAGAYTSDALNLLYNKGVCTWQWWPYEDGNCTLQPITVTNTRAAKYKIKGWQTITRTVDNIKAWVNSGYPVIVGGIITNEFNNTTGSTITSYTKPADAGGHAYVVVGYNDDYSAFKIQNSWGTSWGQSGYAWIHYDIALKYFDNAYVMTTDL